MWTLKLRLESKHITDRQRETESVCFESCTFSKHPIQTMIAQQQQKEHQQQQTAATNSSNSTSAVEAGRCSITTERGVEAWREAAMSRHEKRHDSLACILQPQPATCAKSVVHHWGPLTSYSCLHAHGHTHTHYCCATWLLPVHIVQVPPKGAVLLKALTRPEPASTSRAATCIVADDDAW